MRTPPVILFDNVSKHFTIKHAHSMKQRLIGKLRGKPLTEKFLALDGLSFAVQAGESVAVMGKNGSGKSTALKLLAGVLRPSSGQILTLGRVVGLLEVGAGFHPDLTGRENIFLNAAILGMSRAETEARFDDIVEFSELGEFIDTEVKKYSSGMYSRLGFAIAVHSEFDILIVDEVLSVGDSEFRKKSFARLDRLREAGKTLFIVSHSTSQVRRLCKRGIVLSHGRKVFDGPIEDAIAKVAPKPVSTTVNGLRYTLRTDNSWQFEGVAEGVPAVNITLEREIDGKPVSVIGKKALSNSPVESVNIPESVRVIEPGAFLDCSKLRGIQLPAHLEAIGRQAFQGCVALNNVILPEGLQRIRAHAFASCKSLEQLTIPRSVSLLEPRAFSNAPQLKFRCYDGSLAARLLAERVASSRIEILYDEQVLPRA